MENQSGDMHMNSDFSQHMQFDDNISLSNMVASPNPSLQQPNVDASINGLPNMVASPNSNSPQQPQFDANNLPHGLPLLGVAPNPSQQSYFDPNITALAAPNPSWQAQFDANLNCFSVMGAPNPTHQSPFDANFTGMPAMAAPNMSQQTQFDPNLASGLPLLGGNLTSSRQAMFDPNLPGFSFNAASDSTSLLRNMGTMTTDEMISYIDLIVADRPPLAPTFANNSGIQGNAFGSNSPLFGTQGSNSAMGGLGMGQNGNGGFSSFNFNNLQDHTGTLFDAIHPGGINQGQSSLFASNCLSSNNSMIQPNNSNAQLGIFSSGSATMWQGKPPANHNLDQFVIPSGLLSSQGFPSDVPASSSSLFRPQQSSDHQLLRRAMLPSSYTFNSMDINPLSSTATSPHMSIYDISLTPNATPTPRNDNQSAVTVTSNMLSQAQLGIGNTTGSTTVAVRPTSSTNSSSNMLNNKRQGSLEATSSRPGSQKEVSKTSEEITPRNQTVRERLEQYQNMVYNEPITNGLYDPRFAELGLPVDPFLRMFALHPEFRDVPSKKKPT